jgi:hypothetical protein
MTTQPDRSRRSFDYIDADPMITSQQGALEQNSHRKKTNWHIDRCATNTANISWIKRHSFKSKGNMGPNKEPAQQFQREPLLPLVVIRQTNNYTPNA